MISVVIYKTTACTVIYIEGRLNKIVCCVFDVIYVNNYY